MKSKSSKPVSKMPEKKVVVVQQTPIQSNNVNQGLGFNPPVGMSNANMQQFSNQIPQQQYTNNIPQQMYVPPPQQQVMGGFYGSTRRQMMNNVPQQQKGLPQIFNDDEPLIEKVKQQKKDAKIQIQIKAQRSMVKLKQAVSLPAMCSLKTSGGNRTSVDLICVIDVSGSMSGQKIQLVKDTMKFLVETLTPSDRLSILTFEGFGDRVCGLKCVTPENLVSFDAYINTLSGRGGTNINSGLQLALKTIRDRKHVNKVTSVFLLSDGQDKGAQNTFRQSLQQPQNKDLGVFTIHSFGFGTDHDEDLMTKICEIKDGSFYFIKQLATLDEAFCNALGGIISLVATEVVLKISNISKNIVEGIKIKKTFGDMWQKINEREYRIKLLQLMSGITKDYVFEFEVPAINTEVGDLDRNHDIIEGIFTAKGVNNQNMVGQYCFKITLLNENQEIPQANENVDVIQNYLRVKAAEVIEQNMKKAEQSKYEEAQQGIDNMINCIQNSKKARPQKMANLVNDLQYIKQKCSKQEYQYEGKKCMKSAQMAHNKQSNFAYSNNIQAEMVAVQKAKKSKN